MESPAHQALKLRAAHLLRDHFHCFAVATEVAAPVPRFRIDAAGISDVLPSPVADPPARPVPAPRHTVFIEAKAARSDFLRDARELPRLLAQRERLERELNTVRTEFVRELEPALLARDGLLFPALGTWDYSRSTLHCHRLLVRELARLDTAIHGTTKFFFVARYQLATRLYILCPPGLIDPSETPAGWGLLWMNADAPFASAEAQPAALIARDAPPHLVRDRDIDRALRSIAAAASRAWLGPRPPVPDPRPASEPPATQSPARVQHAP